MNEIFVLHFNYIIIKDGCHHETKTMGPWPRDKAVMETTACIILAAGQGSRFGRPKSLAVTPTGQSVINHILHNLMKVGTAPIIVVTARHDPWLQPKLLKHESIQVVHNNHPEFGQTRSVQLGLSALGSRKRDFFVLPVDVPFVDPATFERLLNKKKESGARIVLPRHRKRRGHPPLFDAGLAAEILRLPPHVRLSVLYRWYPDVLAYADVDDAGVTATFNDPLQWSALLQEFFPIPFSSGSGIGY